MRRFAVIGLGRFGTKLAIALAMSGAEVIAIDKNRDEIELIRDQVSCTVRLDSTDEEASKHRVLTRWMSLSSVLDRALAGDLNLLF